MDKFDEKVIGYESTKNILRQILDALKRPELYKRIRPQVSCLSENQSGKQFFG